MIVLVLISRNNKGSGAYFNNLCNNLVQVALFVALILFNNGVSAKTYKTEDSLILEDDPPQLPGPSIFEYRDNFYPPPPPRRPTQLQEVPESSSNPFHKVKRGHENQSNKTSSEEENPHHHPQYFEIAGDELYVFEPSPMGVRPFMDSIFPERGQSPPREIFHRQRSRHKFPDVIHGKPHSHNHHRFQLHGIKVEQVTSKDALPSVSAVTRGRTISSSPSESNPSHQSRGICISTNEKEGECVPFKVCYPVVFNMVNGELRNLGLARMLYQASGSCDRNETWELQTLSVQVQPGVFSTVPLEIPSNFYNETVCCPGFFRYEPKPHGNVNVIHQSDYHYPQGRHPNHRYNVPKLKPSQLDPMLSPQGRGHSYLSQYQPQPPPHPPFPLPVFHEPLFDSDAVSDPIANSEFDYYVDEFDDYTTTPTPTTTTETPKSQVKKPKLASKRRNNNRNSTIKQESTDTTTIKTTTLQSKPKPKTQSSTTTTTTKTAKANRAESNRSEIKVQVEVENNPVNGNVIKSGNKPEGREKVQSHEIIKSQGPVPVIVPPPHLSAWNCPGRHIGMPRGHWPWMVALLNEGSHFCTGSLVDHRHVLTSATCVASFQGKDIGRMRAILGDRVLYSAVDGPHMWRKILRITRHLQYNPETMDHDIAILEMDNPIVYTPNVQPINLPSSGHRDHTSKAIVSGWSGPDIGKRFFSARPTVDAVVEFMDSQNCFRKYDGFVLGKVPENIICTKPSNSTCRADLGAPLMMKTGNCWHIIGIFSNGLGCGMFPDIFTDIATHIPWIQKNIRQHFGQDIKSKL